MTRFSQPLRCRLRHSLAFACLPNVPGMHRVRACTTGLPRRLSRPDKASDRERKIRANRGMPDDSIPAQGFRPSIFATPFQRSGDGAAVELLSVAEQDELIGISRLINVRRHTVLYP